MACIELKNLSFTYPNAARPALKKLNLTVQEGEFLTLLGPSGGGKSTLLRCLKPALRPHGTMEGEIFFCGEPLDSIDVRRQTAEIGFVLQNPHSQIVTDKVWHELAFGLESLGVEKSAIRRRVAEMAAFFDMESWFELETASLSGGQKQLLNLASVMALQPRVLLLDEPTAQLDPIAATEFLHAVDRIRRELGTTVILSEHRLEEALPLSDRVLALHGEPLCVGTVHEVSEALRGSSLYACMPTPMRLCGASDVSEARQWFQNRKEALLPLPPRPVREGAGPAVELRHVSYRHERKGKNLLQDLNCEFGKGQLTAILGGNGAGKSTTLSLIAGLKRPRQGSVRLHGRIALLPQDPQALFLRDSLREDLADISSDYASVAELCKLNALLDRHPYDLSGGEQQRAALAKILLAEPEILLLDEPTKGLDVGFKAEFAQILRKLLHQGKTVIMVSHDVEFCAEEADRCLLLFDGGFVAEGTARDFFSGNHFYTTAANRIARQRLPEVVTCRELLAVCGMEEPPAPPSQGEDAPPPPKKSVVQQKKPLPWWRLGLSLMGFLASLLLGVHILTDWKLPFLEELSQYVQYGSLVGGLLLSLLPLLRKGDRLKKPHWSTLLLLILVPLTAWLGLQWRGQYMLLSVILLCEMLIPFFLRFEGRRPTARELVLPAVLAALCVAGRTAFASLPQVKPVLALVILSGVGLGSEGGFLVGALSMLLSNLLFGQGPWTLWQMLAMGLVGGLAGLLCRRGILRTDRLSLCVYGAFASVVLYGVLMNFSSAITWHTDLSLSVVLAYCASGFPMDVLQGAATVAFLWLFSGPMLRKLERISQKYGISSEG